ncbi:transposase [Candidatus Margulisiibacteriota bacterium]
MSLTRNKRSPEEKFKILEEAEKSGAKISEVCRQHGISSGQYYQWKDLARKAILKAFKDSGKHKNGKVDLEKDKLREENDRMKSVIAEITAENLDFKKKHSF